MTAHDEARRYAAIDLRNNEDILREYLTFIKKYEKIDVSKKQEREDLLSSFIDSLLDELINKDEDISPWIDQITITLPSIDWTPNDLELTPNGAEYFGQPQENKMKEKLWEIHKRLQHSELIMSYSSLDHTLVEKLGGAIEDGPRNETVNIGINLPINVADHWCPEAAPSRLFGNRKWADRLLNLEPLRDLGLEGKDVIAIIVDQGVNRARIPNNYLGGFNTIAAPASAKDTRHGDMIVRNILKCAPKTKIFDLPIIPPRISDLEVFLDKAETAYDTMLDFIHLVEVLEDLSHRNFSWIIVNAWALFDRRIEPATLDVGHRYSDDPLHPFNVLFETINTHFSDAPVDAIFAAGNCGEFCSDDRCGPNDIGPGRSILGANSHPRVLTVGAVRADDHWIGSSSQGPGLLTPNKPDVCAPSHFSELDYLFKGDLGPANYSASNIGTSAACAMAAGTVALLRCSNNPRNPRRSPSDLFQILRNRSRKLPTAGWDERRGHGTINAFSAFDAM